jgi:trigger factor
MVVPELDEQLRGTRPGAILQFDATLPERFADRAGEDASFRVIVKEAKHKVLPELTDEWVGEVSEFDTVDALRADVRARLEAFARVQAQLAVREQVLQAASELVADDVPDTLVNQEMERRLHDLAHRLEEQMPGVNIPQYLAATGQDQQEFVESLRAGATSAVRADLALRAVVAQEAIDVSDDEVDAEIDRLAAEIGEKPAKVRKDLEQRGVVQAVRSDLERSKALSFLIEHATVVDEDGNAVDLSGTAEDETDEVQAEEPQP